MIRGIRALFRRTIRFAFIFWSILGIALVGVLCSELVSNWLMNRMFANALTSKWKLEDGIYSCGLPEDELPEDPSWIVDLRQDMIHVVGMFEVSADATDWSPFAYWRSAPYAGRYINVDQHGLRRTTIPADAARNENEDEPPTRIFMFGGSSLWGFGARDEYTVPSLLARRLNEAGHDVEVQNFAQIGYVSTQEVITLLQLLQEGKVPDIVVFFDGSNDIAATFINQRAGVSYTEWQRREEFNLLRADAADTFWIALQNLSTVRLISLLRGGGKESAMKAAIRYRDIETVTRDVVRVYANNVAAVDALGERHGFQSLFYWQPNVYEKDSPTQSEAAAVVGHDADRLITQAVYAGFRSAQSDWKGTAMGPKMGPNVHYTGDLFDAPKWETKSAFYDNFHLTEAGNLEVAERIFRDVEKIIAERAAGE